MLNAPFNAMTRAPVSSRPFSQKQSSSACFNPKVVSLVSVLFFSGSPSAIVRAVIAIVVLSLYGVTEGWTATHIGNEVVKGRPSITNIDAAHSVVNVRCVLGIATSSNHRKPRMIFRGALGPLGEPSVLIFVVARTHLAFCPVPALQGSAAGDARIATVAYPMPVFLILASRMRESGYCNFAESPACKVIAELAHNNPFRYTLEGVEAGCKSYSSSGMTLASEQYCHTGDPYVN